MKRVSVVLLCLICFTTQAQDLTPIRAAFHLSVRNPDSTFYLRELIADFHPKSTSLQGYEAACKALEARNAWNPLAKLSLVMQYDKLMSAVMEQEKENLEIRFLRLAIGFHLPAFLGMSEHMEEDKDYLIAHLHLIPALGLDKSFANYIVYFIKQTQLCNPAELAEMEAHFSSSLMLNAK